MPVGSGHGTIWRDMLPSDLPESIGTDRPECPNLMRYFTSAGRRHRSVVQALVIERG
jgi:hypothetical protein